MKPIRVLGGKVLEEVMRDEQGGAAPEFITVAGMLLAGVAVLVTILIGLGLLAT